MQRWTRFLALTVAVLLAAGPACAQGTTTSPTDKSTTGTTDKGTSKTMDKGGDKGAAGAMDKADKGAMKAEKGMKRDRAARAGGQNRDQVMAVQQALKDKGHDPGTIDGVMGPKTQAALRDFQKKEGLKASGRLDQETMAKLGVEMKTGAAGASSPAASPATGDKPSDSSAAPSASPSGDASKPAAPADDPAKKTDEQKTDEQKKQ